MRSGPQPVVGRLAREAIARHRRDDHVEGIGRSAAVRRGIDQGVDDLQLLDDRARPAVRDEHGQGILVLRAHVDEVDVETIDLGDEVRHRIEARLDFAPVIFGGPVAREFLRGRERHALRKVRDGFLLRESCRRDTPAQFGEFRVRSTHLKRTNRRRLHHICEHCHHCLLRSQFATAFEKRGFRYIR